MDTSKAKEKMQNQETERETIKMDSFSVERVRVIVGQKGDVVLFTLTINGVSIYNCRVASGKFGDFISLPQVKGKDDKYYNQVYVALAKDDEKKILDEIQKQLNAE